MIEIAIGKLSQNNIISFSDEMEQSYFRAIQHFSDSDIHQINFILLLIKCYRYKFFFLHINNMELRLGND